MPVKEYNRAPGGSAVIWAQTRLQTRFYLDPATGLPHIYNYNHQVDEDEVKEVLERPGEDRPGREGSRVAMGQTAPGRYLWIIWFRCRTAFL